jgi:hypothetical protein
MTALLNNFTISLRFRLDADAPPAYVKRWNILKNDCEESCDLKEIVYAFRELCITDSVKSMDYLDSVEGGLCLGDKQIRFRNIYTGMYAQKDLDQDIVLLDLVDSSESIWTLEELTDIIEGFKKYANNILLEKCVSGYINLEPKSSDSIYE